MADLTVIVPSRGRPEAAAALVEAFADTCRADTFLLFAVNDDDPTRAGYERVVGERAGVTFVEASTMVEALNKVAVYRATEPGAFAVGFMGDDHRPRTVGWDQAYLDALRDLGSGLVYGDDLLQGERLPTQVAMTADLIRELGFMCPPTLRHMYADNFWLTLGRALGRIRHLPGVVVEHLHPVAGKAEWDEGYRRVNADQVYREDGQAFHAYLRDQFSYHLVRLRTFLESEC